MAFVVSDWRKRTIMPGADVDLLEASEPGFLQATIDDHFDAIFSRLRKRYDVQAMAADPPRTVLRWVTRLTTLDAYGKRGFNPSSEADKASILDPATQAELEIKEAADSQTGLFELPLLAATPANGAVTRGGPLGYSEESPYVWTDIQACNGRRQDGNGRGE